MLIICPIHLRNTNLYTEAVFPNVSPWPGQMKCRVEGRKEKEGYKHIAVSCDEQEVWWAVTLKGWRKTNIMWKLRVEYAIMFSWEDEK